LLQAEFHFTSCTRPLKGVLILVFALLASDTRAANLAESLKVLVEQGNSAEAYQLGLKHPEKLGDPDFDFFFGFAAVESGKLGEGVLALERYLLNFPGNDRARLELARAYFLLGEDGRALDEFSSLRSKSLPQPVVLTIERYIDAIRLRQGRYETVSRFYVEAGLGRDSNVNSGVASSSISLPTLGNVFVSQAGTRLADKFLHSAAGGFVSTPVAPGFSLFAGADLNLRSHETQTAFNQATGGVSAGASLIRDDHIYRLSAAFNRAWIENDRYRDLTGASGEWIYQFNPRQSLNLGLSYSSLGFNGANSVRDSAISALSAGFRQVLALPWQPIVSAGLTYAEERNQENRSDLGRLLTGFIAQITCSPAAEWGVNASYVANKSRFGAQDPLTLVSRSDEYRGLDLSLIYLINRSLSVRGEYSISKNISNLALYEYGRRVFTLKVRHEWK